MISRLLDRKGGRALLGALATWFARREEDRTAKVFHSGVWVQRFGGDFVATGARFKFMHARTYEGLIRQCTDCWFHLYRPQPGDVIVDVGAGLGSDTVVFSRAVGENGKVFSIEAHPETFSLLETTVRLNGLTNVRLSDWAVIDKRRPVYIEDRREHESNTVSLEWTPSLRTQAIEGATLDELCQRHHIDQVDFLKMNIEGAEVLALAGMKKMIVHTSAVCIACHDFLQEDRPELRTRDKVISFLKDSGFSIVTRDNDRRPYVRDHVHGYRPPRRLTEIP